MRGRNAKGEAKLNPAGADLGLLTYADRATEIYVNVGMGCVCACAFPTLGMARAWGQWQANGGEHTEQAPRFWCLETTLH